MWERSISDSNVCERNTKTLVYKGGRGFGHESYGKERGRNEGGKNNGGQQFSSPRVSSNLFALAISFCFTFFYLYARECYYFKSSSLLFLL